MASRLSPLGIFVKWLLVPASLAALGYFIIGPRVGDQVLSPDAKKKIQEVTGQPRPAPAGELNISNDEVLPDEDKPAKNYTAPDVEVTVNPIGNTEREKPRRRRRKKKPPVTPTTPSQQAPGEPAFPDKVPPITDSGTNG